MARTIADELGGELDVVRHPKLAHEQDVIRAAAADVHACAGGHRSGGTGRRDRRDGIGTGSSMLAAIRSVRARKPRKLVVAIGVAPAQSITMIEAEAEEVVCLYAPTDFYAVGQFFDGFSEVTDEMVVTALSPAVRAA